MNRLSFLIEASHALTSYITRQRRVNAARDPAMRRLEDLELLENWTRDLLKLPGKFGSNLSRDPSCIFTSVPPFCPTSSAIYKMSGQAASSSVTVRGQLSRWDACLASVSVGRSHLACLVAASGRHLAVADEVGTITLWDCTTFQQGHALRHSEKLSAICFDASGGRLASYGSHTKLWLAESGQLLEHIHNVLGVIALCLNFTNQDNVLLMGSDRRCLFQCEITADKEPTWVPIGPVPLTNGNPLSAMNMRSPSVLAISPNGSMVIAAYRGYPVTIWSIDPPRIIKRISRKRRPGTTSEPLPVSENVSWHPSSEEFMGIFLDGYSFKYNVLNGTLHEQPPDPGRMPADIHCSPDGDIYATRGFGGSVKLFDYQTSALLCQISSAVGMRNAFLFSQDGGRFFQLRGNQCTVWEPNSLIHLHAADDHEVNNQSCPDESYDHPGFVSETCREDPGGPISVVSLSPKGKLLCTGNDDGLIELFDVVAGLRVEIARTATAVSVEHLVWSKDGSRLIYTEVSGRLTLIELFSDEGWKHRRVKRFKPKMQAGEISEVLFSPDIKSVRVVFHGSAQLWSLESGRLEHTYSGDVPFASLWVGHPQSPGHILSIHPAHIDIHAWVDLTLTARHTQMRPSAEKPHEAIDMKPPSLAGSIEKNSSEKVHEEIEQARETHLPGYVLVMISRRSAAGPLHSRFEVLNTNNFDPVFADTQQMRLSPARGAINIPPEVAGEVEIPLDILPNKRLVFVDRSLRLCTWHLHSSGGGGQGRRATLLYSSKLVAGPKYRFVAYWPCWDPVLSVGRRAGDD